MNSSSLPICTATIFQHVKKSICIHFILPPLPSILIFNWRFLFTKSPSHAFILNQHSYQVQIFEKDSCYIFSPLPSFLPNFLLDLSPKFDQLLCQKCAKNLSGCKSIVYIYSVYKNIPKRDFIPVLGILLKNITYSFLIVTFTHFKNKKNDSRVHTTFLTDKCSLLFVKL